jgi:hypothetical protein
MITLPVTAQMYHSLVQQQMPNNDNTVCVTPMQVQNFISSNSLCGSNLNASTTYFMTNNRNVINLPMKTVIANPTTVQSIYAPKSRTVVRKNYMKKKVLNLSVSKLQPVTSSSPQKSNIIVNNNSTNALNRNKKNSQPQKVDKLQASQNKSASSDEKNDRLPDDPGEAKVKKEDASVEIE